MKQTIIFFSLFLFSILFACNNEPTAHEKQIEQAKNNYEHTLQVQTFQAENGWGYDIYIDGKKFVHQTQIPAKQGNSGFSSEAKAHKTALLVCEKIMMNFMPPTVTMEELDSLDVLN